jgi:hypothetical protein
MTNARPRPVIAPSVSNAARTCPAGSVGYDDMIKIMKLAGLTGADRGGHPATTIVRRPTKPHDIVRWIEDVLDQNREGFERRTSHHGLR